MIIISNEALVPFARRTEFLAFNDAYSTVIQQQPGFQAATLLNSLGTPSKYIRTDRFDTLQSVMNWVDSPALRTFLQQNPTEGVMTFTRPTELAETVAFERGQGELGHISVVEVTLDFRPGVEQAFENWFKELAQLYQQHSKGMVLAGLTRSLAGGGRYALGRGHLTREDAQASFNAPQIAAYREKNPLTNFTSTRPVVNQCQVVHAVVAQRAGVR